MKLSREEQVIVRELVQALRRDHGATDVWLFGSAARSELEPGSDIDLLVVLPVVDWRREKAIADLCFEAELACGRVISVICYSEHELRDTPLRSSPLVHAVRREGIHL